MRIKTKKHLSLFLLLVMLFSATLGNGSDNSNAKVYANELSSQDYNLSGGETLSKPISIIDISSAAQTTAAITTSLSGGKAVYATATEGLTSVDLLGSKNYSATSSTKVFTTEGADATSLENGRYQVIMRVGEKTYKRTGTISDNALTIDTINLAFSQADGVTITGGANGDKVTIRDQQGTKVAEATLTGSTAQQIEFNSNLTEGSNVYTVESANKMTSMDIVSTERKINHNKLISDIKNGDTVVNYDLALPSGNGLLATDKVTIKIFKNSDHSTSLGTAENLVLGTSNTKGTITITGGILASETYYAQIDVKNSIGVVSGNEVDLVKTEGINLHATAKSASGSTSITVSVPVPGSGLVAADQVKIVGIYKGATDGGATDPTNKGILSAETSAVDVGTKNSLEFTSVTLTEALTSSQAYTIVYNVGTKRVVGKSFNVSLDSKAIHVIGKTSDFKKSINLTIPIAGTGLANGDTVKVSKIVSGTDITGTNLIPSGSTISAVTVADGAVPAMNNIPLTQVLSATGTYTIVLSITKAGASTPTEVTASSFNITVANDLNLTAATAEVTDISKAISVDLGAASALTSSDSITVRSLKQGATGVELGTIGSLTGQTFSVPLKAGVYLDPTKEYTLKFSVNGSTHEYAITLTPSVANLTATVTANELSNSVAFASVALNKETSSTIKLTSIVNSKGTSYYTGEAAVSSGALTVTTTSPLVLARGTYTAKFKVNDKADAKTITFNVTPINFNLTVNPISEISKVLPMNLADNTVLNGQTSVTVNSIKDATTEAEHLNNSGDKTLTRTADGSPFVGNVSLAKPLVDRTNYKVALSIKGAEIVFEITANVPLITLNRSTAVADFSTNTINLDFSNEPQLSAEGLQIVVTSVKNSAGTEMLSSFAMTGKTGTITTNAPITEQLTIKLRIDGVDLTNTLTSTLQIQSLDLAKVVGQDLSLNVDVDLTKVDSILDSYVVKVEGIYEKTILENGNVEVGTTNFLDTSRNVALTNKRGTVYLNQRFDMTKEYVLKLNINTVVLPTLIDVTKEVGFLKEKVEITRIEDTIVRLLFPESSLFRLTDQVKIVSVNKKGSSENILRAPTGFVNVNSSRFVDLNLNSAIINGTSYEVTYLLKRDGLDTQFLNGFTVKGNIIEGNGSSSGGSSSGGNISNSQLKSNGIELTIKYSIVGKLREIKINIEGAKAEYDEKRKEVLVTGLVPGKKYDKIAIDIDTDKDKYNIDIRNYSNPKSENELENYVAQVYVQALGRYADEVGYNYHINEFKNGKVELEKFLLNLLVEKEFINRHKTSQEKIVAIYRTILGRDSDSEGESFWIEQYEGYLRDYQELGALELVLKRMFNESEFKNLKIRLY